MDSMSEGEANEIAWWLNNGPALLDAAQSAQERAEAAERRANALIMELAAEKQRNWDETRDSLRQDRDTARAENAALREALGEARESGFHGFACKLEQREPPCGGWSDEQIAEDCTCWVGRAAALTPQPPTIAS